jgi:glycosyltransferase involved in cell wall biosynthesis
MKAHFLRSRLVYFSKANLSLGGFFQFSAGYPGAIKRLKPDIIFENPYTTLTPRSYQTYFAARANRIPMVYVDPGDIPQKGAMKKLLARMEGPIVRNAGHVIVYNEMGRDRFIKEYGYPAERISVVPKPVDTRRFSPEKDRDKARARLGAGDRFVVAYIGRLSNNKGAAHLLKAAKLLSDAGMSKRFLFAFVGGNITRKDAEDIMTLREKLGMDNVHFTGPVPNSEMSAFQAAADAIVYPDVTNLPGFSTVLAESMAMGKAIIIGIKGFEGAVPLSHMGNAMIIEARNEMKIAESIRTLEGDAALAATLGKNARRYAEENMAWEVQVKIYKSIFERAVER